MTNNPDSQRHRIGVVRGWHHQSKGNTVNKRQLRQAIKACAITEAAVMRASYEMPELGWLLCVEQPGNDEAHALTNKAGEVKLYPVIDAAIDELAAAGFSGSVAVAWSRSCS